MTLDPLQKRLGYTFEDSALLRRALSHRSVGGKNNERLEFLGDAALGYIVARRLFEKFGEASEADLTLMRADLVCRETLAAVAREIKLGGSLELGTGERKSGGWDRDSILADALEAVIGAALCDGGIDAAGRVVERLFAARVASVQSSPRKDPKTLLQEAMQAQRRALPVYVVVAQTGGDHERVYNVECRVESLDFRTVGSGSSRRDAEKEAASQMLEKLDAPVQP